jgi:hypothetical protein
MKALKINSNVNTSAGITIPPGAVVVILQSLVDQQNVDRVNAEIPGQIALGVWATKAAWTAEKTAVSNIITDFPMLLKVKISAADYDAGKMEAVFIREALAELEKVYPGNVTTINL